MTPNDDIHGNRIGAGADANVDKILDHNRLQLSALLDGELSPDEARFLLRRLQHDAELGGCWERWQLCGEVLRGRAEVPLPAGFAARVADAVAHEPAVPAARGLEGPRWLRWGGGAALAASVAVIALFLARQAPEATDPARTAAPIATTTAQRPAPPPVSMPAAPRPASPAPAVPDQAGQLASALAVADVPRRLATRRSRGQAQRAASRVAARAVQPAVAAAAGVGTHAVNPLDPFSAGHVNVNLPDRPWPRALLPGTPASGAFTVDYGNSGARPSFYPFEPRVPSSTPYDDQGRADASSSTPPDP